MARGKRKTKAFEQGAIKEIYTYFFRPLLRLKPEGINFHDWIDEIFCVRDRHITRYEVKSAFTLPGKFWMSPNRLAPGYGNRSMKTGYQIWVRKDETMPDKIDVEVWAGQGMKQSVYTMTRREFDRIKPNLKESPFRKYKRIKYSWDQK